MNNEIQIAGVNIQSIQKMPVTMLFNSPDDERKNEHVHQEQDKMNGFRPIEFIRSNETDYHHR